MARAAGLVCLASIGLMLLVTFWGGAELPPVQITSDTPAYCSQLLQRVGQLTHVASGTPRQEAANLAGEGGTMPAGEGAGRHPAAAPGGEADDGHGRASALKERSARYSLRMLT